ncbi:glycosyltransferase 87 family protein [Cellulomonas sp. URHE0023]|uniref:glycosyltransferase 87 family protein n=1 Tax=Cellulomonas sp. URHE0023 TaxID=1380354 RepID=UPI000ADA6F8B|nr:glycosyltransferase 87 family protein [Cellulomonas sp. URHE0023]
MAASDGPARVTSWEVPLRSVMQSKPAVWVAFGLVHGWLAFVGLVMIPARAFWDLELYRYWMWLGLHEGQWPVLTGDWVYPAGAIVPMLAAAPGGTGGGSQYATVWALMVTVLDAVAIAFLLRAPRPDRPRSGGTTTGAWWWLAFLLLLGPIAMGRLDGVVAPVVVVALAIALDHPRIASSLLTAAAWVKVAPGTLLLSMFFAVRRPWRSVVVPGALVSAVIIGAVALGGGLSHVASFLTEQDKRGVQIESPGATPWIIAGLFTSSVRPFLNEPIVTWEIVGPGTQAAADVLGILQPVTLGLAVLLLWWRRERIGAALWSGGLARTELLIRGAMLITLVLLVFNKVGSPQYMTWLAPPVAVALALRLPGWKATAWITLGVAGATQLVFPWQYNEVIQQGPGITLVLAARNVALVALLVHTVVVLVRAPREDPSLEAPARSLAAA